MKKNFVFAGLSILILSAALIITSFPVHPPVLSNSNEQVAYSEINFPVHPPVLEQMFPVHPPVL